MSFVFPRLRPYRISEPTGALHTRAGVVRADGHVLVDDAGPFNAIGTTLFPLPYLFKFERDRLRRNLEFLQGRVHYVRALSVVGGTGWEDRAADPRWPDWDEVIAGATDLCWDAFRIRVEWCVFGNDAFTRDDASMENVVRRIGAVVAQRPEKVIAFEIMNEAWQNGLGSKRELAKHLCRVLRGLVPNLVAVTNPQEQADDNDGRKLADEIRSWYDGANATMITHHPSRDQRGSGGLWRPVRQPWEMQFWAASIPSVWNIDEPIGPRSSDGMDDDPERLAMTAATAPVCGCGLYTLHTGAGVRMGGAADQGGGKPYLPREKNLFEVPTMDATLNAIVTLEQLLPPTIANGSRQNSNANYPNHPFDTKELDESKVLRAYASIRGSEFVCVCIQTLQDITLRATRAMHLRIFDAAGVLLQEQDLDSGGATSVAGVPGGKGYVIVGTFR